MKAGSIIVGGMINIGADKRKFIELGIGHTFGAQPLNTPLGKIDQNGLVGNIGFGLRLGGKVEDVDD